MLKILVFSDSHGCLSGMEEAVGREQPDLIFHLGDYVRDYAQLRCLFPQIPGVSLAGNCDFAAQEPVQVLTEEGGVRIFACHGHTYQVKSGLLRLKLAAKEKGADLCLFGHTHAGFCEKADGIWFLNPGASGGGWHRTYGVVTIADGEASCWLRTL
ncbi:MAG: metallophosphoesterase [Oscillospiraceae bacterium]|nr:metallophosphoesterase [Oscillospiraceae bacterium]